MRTSQYVPVSALTLSLFFGTTALVWAGGVPATGVLTDQLQMITGSESKTDDGDYLTARDGLATTHRFFVEVPAGADRLVIDLFDMDLLAGANDTVEERDRPRTYPNFDPDVLATYSNEVFMSVVEYTLFDPDGNSKITKRRRGSRWAPSGADNAWLTFFDSATASTTGATATWRDNFSTVAYSNNDGTQSFATSWIESQETGVNSSAGPASGLLRVTGTRLRLNNLGDIFPYTGRTPGIERELDLSAYTSATVSFDFFFVSNSEKDDIVVFEASDDGGATWTTLDDIAGGTHGVAHNSSRTYDISDFISSNTRLRFRVAYLYAGASENFEIDNFEVRATTDVAPAPQAGHWEVRVSMAKALSQSATVENGDETNAYAIRAHDGNSGAGGDEFNLYTYVHTGGLNTNDSTRDYTMYPLITGGCDFDSANFDFDADLPANLAPDPDINPPFGTFSLTGRINTFTHTFTDLSDNDAWYSENITSYTDDDDAVNYGIWTADFRIDDPLDGNYVPHFYSEYDAAVVTPPSSNIPTDSYRIYFPNDAGNAPAKPYILQFVRFLGTQPFGANNPPTPGQVARYQVYVYVVNPSGAIGSVTFDATRTVTSFMPGGLVTYQGVALLSQGAVLSAPTVGSNVAGNIVWNPGVLAAGSGGNDNYAILVYTVDVAPTVTPYTIPVVGTPGSGNGTRATWLDETGYDVTRSIFSTGELCQLEVQNDTPTPALISSFRSVLDRGQVVVEWQTAAEAGTLAFELQRETQGTWQQVQQVTALLDSPQGGVYRVVDPAARPFQKTRYRLVEKTARGHEVYGPFEVSASLSADSALDVPFTADAHPASARQASWRERQEALKPHPRPTFLGGLAEELKVEVGERGLYRIDRATLMAAFGLSETGLDDALRQQLFDLRRETTQIAWVLAPKLAGIDFFAPGIDSPFTGKDVYWLRQAPGLTMQRLAQQAPPAGNELSFRTHLHAEQNLRPVVLLPLDPAGDIFFWDFVRANTPAASRNFSFEVADPTDTGLAATLHLDLLGGTAGEHQLEISLNGSPLGMVEVAGTTATRPTLAVPSHLLVPGANTVSVTAVAGDLVFVEAFDLEYDRRYRAQGDVLLGESEGRLALTVSGFTQGGVRVFDVTDVTRPRVIASVRLTADGPTLKATWRTGGSSDFLALNENAVKTPWVVVDQPSSLAAPENQADYLVIATTELAEAAQGLADLRAARGWVTQVVDLEDIYDEFSFGRRDARAIRAFLRHAYQNWALPPRYVALVGHGTYDYRDYLGYHNNLLPVLLWQDGQYLYPTDALYGDLIGEDGSPEMRVGRLPVLDATELQAYLAKLTSYEAGVDTSWDENILLLADQSGAGGDFRADSAAVARLLPAGYQDTSLALEDFPDLAAARARLLAELQTGAALVHYSGHGAVDRLSSSGWLQSADVLAGLGNEDRPMVLTAITCHVGFHGLPTLDSLAEELVLAPQGGAIAAFAPTWLSEDHRAQLLADRLFRALFAAPSVVFGDATATALHAAAAEGHEIGLLYAYQLLGDPALLFKATPRPETPTCTEDCGNG